MTATLTGQIRERLGREQLVAVVGKKRVHRPAGDQVAAPGRRVHLAIGCMACWAHTQHAARCQLPARTTGSTQPPRSTTTAEPRLIRPAPGAWSYPLSMRQGRSSATATVLFSDLVESTELLSQLGEATFDTVRRAHFERCKSM